MFDTTQDTLIGSAAYVDQQAGLPAELLELIRVTTPQGVVLVEEAAEDPDEPGEEDPANTLYGSDAAVQWLTQRARERRGYSALPLSLYDMTAIDFMRYMNEPDCRVEVPAMLADEVAAMLAQDAESAAAAAPAILRSIGEGEPETSASDVLASESWRMLDGLAQLSVPVLDSVAIDSSDAIERLTTALTLAQGESMESMTTGAKIAHVSRLQQLSNQLDLRQRLPVVLIQNRDRASSESAAQIQRMAQSLDIEWLGSSTSPLSGCPIVFFDYDAWESYLALAYIGAQETVRMPSTGREIQTVYAMLPANVVMCSHDHNGLPHAGYELAEVPGRARAVAGNGRVAAIQYAYSNALPSAITYRAGLSVLADSIGLDPDLAETMHSPMLVRVMHHEALTADIGVETNTPAK